MEELTAGAENNELKDTSNVQDSEKSEKKDKKNKKDDKNVSNSEDSSPSSSDDNDGKFAAITASSSRQRSAKLGPKEKGKSPKAAARRISGQGKRSLGNKNDQENSSTPTTKIAKKKDSKQSTVLEQLAAEAESKELDVKSTEKENEKSKKKDKKKKKKSKKD